MNKRLFPLCFLLALHLSVAAQLRPSAIFGSHMVLQQNTTVPIWGWAARRAEVRLQCSWLPGQVLRAQADRQGRWSVPVPTPAGSLTPQQITLSTRSDTLLWSDVLIGEVWLCSGQSNMEWKISQSKYTPEQTRAAAFPHIRQVKIPHAVSLEPLEIIDAGLWEPCNDSTVQRFSGVGYFFARELAERYNLPVGLVNSSWGGSQVESWMSRTGMAQSEAFSAYATNFPKTWTEADARSLAKIKEYVFGVADAKPDSTTEANYINPNLNLQNWKTLSPNYAWDWQQFWAFRGSGCMAVDFQLSAADLEADATLRLGRADGPLDLIFNGKMIWSGDTLDGQEITLPARTIRPGNNRLLVRQRLGKRTDWVQMGLQGPASDFWIKTATGTHSLAGKWQAMPIFSEPHYFVHSSNNHGTAIYNAMIHPIARLPIKGVIWYQGESNAGRAWQYREAFPLLIRDWRRLWGSEFPFLFVQLANWEAGKGDANTGSDWAELREAQALTLQLPRTGMAVTIDIGESKDIHPKNKHDVGLRLAHEARRIAYGENLAPGSPPPPRVQFSADTAYAYFELPAPGLMVRDSAGAAQGFELAGEDRVFHPAQAVVEGATIRAWSAAVPKPLALRYAWADDPQGLNVYTREGFPLAPFRSDDWPCKTRDGRFE